MLELPLRLLANGSALGSLLLLELFGFDISLADAVPLPDMSVGKPASLSVARHVMAEKMPAASLELNESAPVDGRLKPCTT